MDTKVPYIYTQIINILALSGYQHRVKGSTQQVKVIIIKCWGSNYQVSLLLQ